MNEIINHEEAYLLACAKQSESNLARCYLDIKTQRNELLRVLQEAQLITAYAASGMTHAVWMTERAISTDQKVRATITKFKGE